MVDTKMIFHGKVNEIVQIFLSRWAKYLPNSENLYNFEGFIET